MLVSKVDKNLVIKIVNKKKYCKNNNLWGHGGIGRRITEWCQQLVIITEKESEFGETLTDNADGNTELN